MTTTRHYDYIVTARQLVADRESDQKPAPEFFVDYVDVTTHKCYGIRHVALAEVDLSRACGAWGERKLTLTEPITIQRGHHETILKASKRKPVAVRETLYAT